MVTSLNELDRNAHYTYADCILWQFQERVELLKGRLFPMAAPNVKHQRISSNLPLKLASHFLYSKCDSIRGLAITLSEIFPPETPLSQS